MVKIFFSNFLRFSKFLVISIFLLFIIISLFPFGSNLKRLNSNNTNYTASKNSNYNINLASLCYHNINDVVSTDYDISTSSFEIQMKYLFDNNFITLTATELIESLRDKIKIKDLENKKIAIITFDDASLGQYEKATPILTKYGMKATFFIYPSIIQSTEKGKHKNYMTFSQIKKLAQNPAFEIGCHSYYHPYMTKEDEKGLVLNTIKAKSILEKEIGINIKTFAYPFGLYNEKVISYVKKAGFIGAFKIDKGYINEETDNWKIPRFIITSKTSLETFKKIVNFEINMKN